MSKIIILIIVYLIGWIITYKIKSRSIGTIMYYEDDNSEICSYTISPLLIVLESSVWILILISWIVDKTVNLFNKNNEA